MKTITKTGHTVSTAALLDGAFETMVFFDGDEVDCIRTKTVANSKKAHKHMVSLWSTTAASYWAKSAGESVFRSVLRGHAVDVVAK